MENQHHIDKEEKTVQHKSSAGLAVSGFDAGDPSQPSDIQSAANNTGRLQQLKSIQAAANRNPRVSQLKTLQRNVNRPPVQRQAAAGAKPVQMKWFGVDHSDVVLQKKIAQDPLRAYHELLEKKGLSTEASKLLEMVKFLKGRPKDMARVNDFLSTCFHGGGLYSLGWMFDRIVEDCTSLKEEISRDFITVDSGEALDYSDLDDIDELLVLESDGKEDDDEDEKIPSETDGHEERGDAPELTVDPVTDIHPEKIDLPTLELIMKIWVVGEKKLCTEKDFSERFKTWYEFGRSVTRTEFNKIFTGFYSSSTFQHQSANDANPVQLARTPNTISSQVSYKGKNGFTYKNVSYMRDGVGNIDFANPYGTYTAWKNPEVTGSTVQLNTGSKKKRWGIMKSGKKVEIPKASRSQHFSIGDRLYPNSRKGKFTWHHLSSEYHMILVDMTVHAKHGHNGGVYIWK